MIQDLKARVASEGFARVSGEDMGRLIGAEALIGWPAYSASWADLAPDQFMADGGRYRRRRYAAFEVDEAGARRLPHQPHFQSLDYNRLNGGVDRWFEPITEQVAGDPLTDRIIGLCRGVFGAGGFPWRCEMHQFRIEARAGEIGQPTPEGVHRDGVDWVLVMLVARRNVAAGETSIFDPQGRPLGSFTLTEPLDAVFLDDARVFHGVTAIEAVDRTQPAFRDVLVATFRRKG
ncbi:MAG TPA: 2OG-Fe dioxygenase family protein [Phenylobacterium sp.]|uniref:2OG-Fe dioxygenase family protein n=1 Tax=Phenylobacterium sp. TaxID=1871053 RepID=UPI002F9233A9